MGKNNDTEKVIGLLRWDRGRSYGHISRKDANEMVAKGEAKWAGNIGAVLLPRPGDPLPKNPVKATAVKPSPESTNDGYDKTDKPAYAPRGLSAKPNPSLTERYISAIESATDSDTNRAVIAAVTAWSPDGLTTESGLFE